MAASVQPAPLAFSTAFGLLMVTAAAVHADKAGYIALALAVMALLTGLVFRVASTLSELLVIAAIVLSDPSPVFAAVSGLSAAAYLVVRHAARPSAGLVTKTRPTVVGMVGMTLVGLIATSVPLHLPWLPLLAPPAVVVLFVVVTLPLARNPRGDFFEGGDARAE
jgi:uncharacterized membrane protein YdcZ (DUF606 family)